MSTIALSPLLGILVAAVVMIAIARPLREKFWFSLVLSIAVGAIAGAVLLILADSTDWADYLYFVVAYPCLGFCFFHFNNLAESSIRYRVLEELRERGGEITLAELKANYDSTHIVTMRLGRLLEAGRIEMVDGKLRANSPVLRVIVTLIYGVKRLLFGQG